MNKFILTLMYWCDEEQCWFSEPYRQQFDSVENAKHYAMTNRFHWSSFTVEQA